MGTIIIILLIIGAFYLFSGLGSTTSTNNISNSNSQTSTNNAKRAAYMDPEEHLDYYPSDSDDDMDFDPEDYDPCTDD